MRNVMCDTRIKLILLTSFCAGLLGCGGSDSNELDNTLSHSAALSFVNSLDASSDFYLDKRSISLGYSGLFDSKNKVSDDVNYNSVSATYSYSYKAMNNMINIGIKENNGAEEKNYHTLKNGDNLWVVAWLRGDEKKISVIPKKKQLQADQFSVRIFANGNYPVVVDGNQAIATKTGQISNYITVNNCASGLQINGANIDLCTGDFGQSYLLVVDAKGKRVMAQE